MIGVTGRFFRSHRPTGTDLDRLLVGCVGGIRGRDEHSRKRDRSPCSPYFLSALILESL